jgi:hypothetical protein
MRRLAKQGRPRALAIMRATCCQELRHVCCHSLATSWNRNPTREELRGFMHKKVHRIGLTLRYGTPVMKSSFLQGWQHGGKLANAVM